jgi:S1-C subfamily serine protease
MEETHDSRFDQWRRSVLRLLWYIRRGLPFALGVLATFLAIVVYNRVTPQPKALTEQDVQNSVAQAMASATPPPAYSAIVYQIIQPSLVLIQTKGSGADGKSTDELGSGVIINTNGDILTALHVVDQGTDIQVFFYDGTKSPAQVTTKQPENDIAVLHTDTLPAELVPAVMGNPNAMHVGDDVYAVGNPYGLYSSMSAGVISGFNRDFKPEGSDQELQGLIQFDAAVNPGNSGGPLLNRYGQVVGIVEGILNPTDQSFFVGIGFAVPITTAGGAAGAPQY